MTSHRDIRRGCWQVQNGMPVAQLDLQLELDNMFYTGCCILTEWSGWAHAPIMGDASVHKTVTQNVWV